MATSTIQRHAKQPASMPELIAPMLATSGDLPLTQADYAFEFKWDGVRAIGYFAPGKHRLLARSGTDITARYPELKGLADAVGRQSVILDGEIVSLNELNQPDFGRLQHRMHLRDAKAIARLSITQPVFYVLFDVLYLKGRSVMAERYDRRREMLEKLTLMGDVWQVTNSHFGEGSAMLETARQNHLEGLVAKKLDSTYLPGNRSSDWIKIKIIQRQEFVVAGWIPERTGSADRIGAILVGYYDNDDRLRYAGKVGTGLSAADHAPLLKKLFAGHTPKSPFSDPVPRGAIFTAKPIVAEVEYRRWPANGLLQQAAFKGVRTDKAARDVVRESI